MFLDSDLPPMVAMEIVQGARGPAAIQTIKVCEVHCTSAVALYILLPPEYVYMLDYNTDHYYGSIPTHRDACLDMLWSECM